MSVTIKVPDTTITCTKIRGDCYIRASVLEAHLASMLSILHDAQENQNADAKSAIKVLTELQQSVLSFMRTMR